MIIFEDQRAVMETEPDEEIMARDFDPHEVGQDFKHTLLEYCAMFPDEFVSKCHARAGTNWSERRLEAVA